MSTQETQSSQFTESLLAPPVHAECLECRPLAVMVIAYSQPANKSDITQIITDCSISFSVLSGDTSEKILSISAGYDFLLVEPENEPHADADEEKIYTDSDGVRFIKLLDYRGHHRARYRLIGESANVAVGQALHMDDIWPYVSMLLVECGNAARRRINEFRFLVDLEVPNRNDLEPVPNRKPSKSASKPGKAGKTTKTTKTTKGAKQTAVSSPTE